MQSPFPEEAKHGLTAIKKLAEDGEKSPHAHFPEISCTESTVAMYDLPLFLIVLSTRL